MNKLYNNDAFKIMQELETNSIDSIITDPPYGVNFKSHYEDSEYIIKIKSKKWLDEMFRVLKEGSHCYIFIGTKTIHWWIQNALDVGFNYKNLLITNTYGKNDYVKDNFSFNSQPILFLSKGKANHLKQYDYIETSNAWKKDKRNKNPKKFTYKYPSFINKFSNTKSTSLNNKQTNRHPNEKNIELIKFLIGVSTDENMTVLDPFMGSGTTGVSCEELNRNFIGVEKDKKYFDIAKEKIEEKELIKYYRLDKIEKEVFGDKYEE